MARPKSFQPDEALDKAMGVFWERGFEGASIAELTEAMGINRFSLYDTFGDKRELFLKALDRYSERVVSENLGLLGRAVSLDDIGAFLRRIVDQPCPPNSARGCLMARCAMEGLEGDEDVASRIRRSTGRLHEAYQGALRRARERGELAAGVRIPDAAWTLVMLQRGLIAMDMDPPPARAVRASIRATLDALRA